MPKLDSLTGTFTVLDRYNFHVQKRFGQNFLIDGNILDKIIQGAEIDKDDCVLEIGPGIGTMTQYLCEHAGNVVAVEIDKALIPILNDTLSSYNNVTVLNGDILKTDLAELSEKYADGKPFKVVANLPYYITTPVIMALLETRVPVESITVMVQKEVAQRMQVGPGTKDYGALSLAVQYYAEPEVLAEVSRECFLPKPNVDSAVIRLRKYENPPIAARNERLLFRLIRAAFNQRRKTLVNAIGNDPSVPVTKEQAAEALKSLGLDEKIRGEALTLAQFAALADAVQDAKKQA